MYVSKSWYILMVSSTGILLLFQPSFICIMPDSSITFCATLVYWSIENHSTISWPRAWSWVSRSVLSQLENTSGKSKWTFQVPLIYCSCTVYIKCLFQSMVFKIKVKLKENQSAKFQNILLLLLVTYSDFSIRLILDEIFICTYMNYVIWGINLNESLYYSCTVIELMHGCTLS